MMFTTTNEKPVLLRLAVMVVLLGIAGCQHRTSPAPLIGGVTVSGRVLEGGGNAGLGHVEVGLYAGDVEKYARPLMSGTTNASGYFSISSVEPGAYLFRAVRAGYRESNQRLLVARTSMPSLTIRLFPGSSACVASAAPHAAVTNCP
jgi:hypothetical protein